MSKESHPARKELQQAVADLRYMQTLEKLEQEHEIWQGLYQLATEDGDISPNELAAVEEEYRWYQAQVYLAQEKELKFYEQIDDHRLKLGLPPLM